MRIRIVLIGLFFAGIAHAQVNMLPELNRQLSESRTQFPGMRPLVFFAQDKYAPGDTAFFRLFILTEAERILAERSLLTLELLNPKGIICARQMVSCQRFGAANQLILPDSLRPGFYEARFFSDRMTMAYGRSAPLMIVGERKVEQRPRTLDTLTIHPEGGHVVPGMLNRIIVRAEGKAPVSAALHSDEGRITTVTFEENVASVQFIPQKDRRYWLESAVGDQTSRQSLPPVEIDALTMRVYRGPKQTWVLDMATGPQGPRTASLILMAQREIYHSQEIKFNADDRANLLVAPDFFPEGFSELYLIDNQLKVLAYRPFYTAPRAKGAISISGLPESAGFRQEIGVGLNVSDEGGQPVRASMAIAVIPDDVRLRPLQTPDPTLELRPAPPEFDWTLPPARIEQEIITTSGPPKVVPEYPLLVHNSNLTLTGRVISDDPDSPIPYLSRIVIYLQKDLIQYETGVDGAGNFSFPKIYDFLGSDRVFYKVIHQGKLAPNVRVDWSVNPGEIISGDHDHYVESSEADAYGVLRKRKRSIDRSYGFFLSSEKATEKTSNFNAQLEDEFQGADITVNPGEYVPFETMRELILEVIPALKFRYRGGDSVVHLDLYTHSPFAAQRYAEGPPLYIIDGYMTTNTRYFLSLPPKDVISVKLINEIEKLNRLENLAKDGIVFVQTRMPEQTRQFLESKLHGLDGLSPTLTAPTSYPSRQRVPDLRSLVYWTPLMETDSAGSATFNIRTSDIPGTYWIRVIGTTASGHVITTEKKFVVNYK